MKFTKRRMLVAAVAVASVLATAACSSNPTSGSGSTAAASSCTPAKGKVTLQYWNTVPGMDKVVDLWNSEHPNIQVDIKDISNNQYGTISNALKANNAPDLAQVGYDELSTMRLQNAFADASACKAVVAAKSDFVPWTWSQATFGSSSVYALPQDTGPMALYYRADLFKKYDIPVPTTWAEYATDAATLKAKDPSLDMTFFDPNNAEWFNGLLWQDGANMYSYSNGKWSVSVTNSKNKQVADYWQNLISKKLVRTDLANLTTPMYAAYNSNQVATYVGAAWGYSLLRDNLPSQSGKWAVAPLPNWSASTPASGDWGGSTVAFMKGGKHLYEAAEFNVWLNTNTKALALENSLGGLYPAAKKGLEMPSLKAGVPFYGGQKIFDTFKEASSNINTDFTWGPTQKTTNLALQDAMAKAANGNGTLSDALEAAQQSAIQTMKQQDIPVAK